MRLDARFHEAHNALAFAQRRRGDFERAVTSCRRALDLRTDYAAAWHNLGLTLLDLGRTDEAIEALLKGSACSPSIAQLHVLLVRLLRDAGRMEEAERAAIAARSHHPHDRDLMTHVVELASEHRKAKRPERSEELLRALLADWPETPEIHVNLANSLSDQQRIEEAVDACRAALTIDPSHPEARSKLVAYLRDTGRYDESLAVGCAAVAADEQFIEARVNLALTQLTLGLMPEGWHNYEARLKAVNYRFPLADLGEAAAIERYWSGRELTAADEHGGVLLVFAEQGLGDTLQFLRFLPAARTRARRLVFAVQKALIPLLRSQLEYHPSADAAAIALGFDELTPHLETWPAHDAFVSLMSLPHIFNTTLDSFTDTGPQVRPTQDRLDHWRRWFDEHHPRVSSDVRRIGIAWQGNRAYARDPQRSIPL
ncbi:MAG TPA: tetratricopeptide repeat protein, partial [Pirellulaceae bacterium]|nr:tetratricopeptide repeat protein [Pirellulaceae bacterium]